MKPFNNILNFDKLNILILVGGHDSPEFQRQSLAYYEKLKLKIPDTTSNSVKFYKSETDDHFTIIQNLAVESSNAYKSVHEILSNLVG